MTWLRRFTIHARVPSRTAGTPTQKNPELSRLPKAPSIRSIRFKRTTPGTASHLFFPSTPLTTPALDPTHPLLRSHPGHLQRIVPHYHCSLFSVHIFPHAILRKFALPQIMSQLKGKGASDELEVLMGSWTTRMANGNARGRQVECESTCDDVRADAGHVGDHRRAVHALPMSLMIVTSKKGLHKGGVVRTKVKRRLKEALNLVVIRGAGPSKRDGLKDEDGRIVFRTPGGLQREVASETSGVLQGWAYVIRPSLEVYRCPWPMLLLHLREALSHTRSLALELEAKWEQARRHGEQHGFDSNLKKTASKKPVGHQSSRSKTTKKSNMSNSSVQK